VALADDDAVLHRDQRRAADVDRVLSRDDQAVDDVDLARATGVDRDAAVLDRLAVHRDEDRAAAYDRRSRRVRIRRAAAAGHAPAAASSRPAVSRVTSALGCAAGTVGEANTRNALMRAGVNRSISAWTPPAALRTWLMKRISQTPVV